MNRSTSPPPYSLRLLLYLEWILLGCAVLSVCVPMRSVSQDNLWLSGLTIAIFALIGLRLPSKWLAAKVLYTALEFGLILLPTLLDSIFGQGRFVPFLGLIAVIRGCRMFRLPGRLAVASTTLATFLLAIAHAAPMRKPPLPESRAFGGPSNFEILTWKVNTVVFFGLAIAFVLLLINALLAERQSREQLAHAHEQLRQYAMRIEDQAALQERNRIAREIHDSLGHSLTAQSIQLENALLFLPPNSDKSQSFINSARQLASQALKEVRQSVATLRSDPLQGRCIEEAIATLTRNFHAMTNITPSYSVRLSQPLTPEARTAIYRILQEALTNIHKHSHASHVSLTLEETDSHVQLQIEDDGKGFDPRQNTTGFGLQSMQERTAAIGGWFGLDSKPGQGCRIVVTLPLTPLPSLRSAP